MPEKSTDFVWKIPKNDVILPAKINSFFDMAEILTPEAVWFLKEMTAKSEKDFAEGRVFSHEQVKEMLKTRRHGDQVVAACV